MSEEEKTNSVVNIIKSYLNGDESQKLKVLLIVKGIIDFSRHSEKKYKNVRRKLFKAEMSIHPLERIASKNNFIYEMIKLCLLELKKYKKYDKVLKDYIVELDNGKIEYAYLLSRNMELLLKDVLDNINILKDYNESKQVSYQELEELYNNVHKCDEIVDTIKEQSSLQKK